jgi:hypothetical protein
LAKTRKCAWLGVFDEESALPVWACGSTMAFRCPKSIITARSISFIEQFLYWRQVGGDVWEFDAKVADAMLLLQEETAKENENEKK